MTPYQVKAARSLLGWSRRHLAFHSATSEDVIETLEKGPRVAGRYGQMEQGASVAIIRGAFEAAGIEFTDGAAPGVRLRKPAGTE